MKFLLLRLVIASLAAAVVAPPALPQPIEQSLTFPIIALDHHGRPVKNLTPDSLLILDNKTPIVSGVKLLRAADFPLRLGIVIDTSRSQSDNRLYEAGLNAAKEFVNQVLRSEQDRVFFQLFSDTSKATPLLDRNQISGVSFNVQVGGGTALYDAIVMACHDRMALSDPRAPTRRIVGLLSDGEDNASRNRLAMAEDIVASSGVVIFSIGTEISDRSRGKRVLDAISKTSGGAAFTDLSSSEVSKAFAQIRELMDSMYQVSFPPPSSSKGRVHALEIKAAKGAQFELLTREKVSFKAMASN